MEMDQARIKHCLTVLKNDLGRESLLILKHELEQIVEIQTKSIDLHGSYLTTTKEEDLPKLKIAAVLNKSRKEAAQHVLAFFNVEYLDKAIANLAQSIREKEENE